MTFGIILHNRTVGEAFVERSIHLLNQTAIFRNIRSTRMAFIVISQEIAIGFGHHTRCYIQLTHHRMVITQDRRRKECIRKIFLFNHQRAFRHPCQKWCSPKTLTKGNTRQINLRSRSLGTTYITLTCFGCNL